MSRDIYNSIEAINASSIKRHYTGSIQYAAGALERGAEFHRNLLETEPKDMPPNAKLIYDAIMKHPMLRLVFEKSAKEITFIKDICTSLHYLIFQLYQLVKYGKRLRKIIQTSIYTKKTCNIRQNTARIWLLAASMPPFLNKTLILPLQMD